MSAQRRRRRRWRSPVPWRAATAARPVDVGAVEHPVAGDVGDDERAAPTGTSRGLVERHAGALGPAVDGDLAVAVIETDGDATDLRGGRRPARDPAIAAEPITTRATPASASAAASVDACERRRRSARVPAQ